MWQAGWVDARWGLLPLSLAILAGPGACSASPKAGCQTSGDCSSDQMCFFPIGSCSAQGQCLDPNAVGSSTQQSSCGAASQPRYCGCDRSVVLGPCGVSYAYAPTMGESAPCAPPATVVSGATLTTLATLPQSAPASLVVDTTSVYFTTDHTPAVVKVPLDGGTPRYPRLVSRCSRRARRGHDERLRHRGRRGDECPFGWRNPYDSRWTRVTR